MSTDQQRIDKLTQERDELRRALEIIAVGDAQNPQAQAAEELIALGYWRDIPEARQPVNQGNDMNTYSVKIELSVHDPQALWHAAVAQAMKECAGSDLILALLGTREDPNIGACLIMILDPGEGPAGAEILHSEVE